MSQRVGSDNTTQYDKPIASTQWFHDGDGWAASAD
jgi:hypothetical protein